MIWYDMIWYDMILHYIILYYIYCKILLIFLSVDSPPPQTTKNYRQQFNLFHNYWNTLIIQNIVQICHYVLTIVYLLDFVPIFPATVTDILQLAVSTSPPPSLPPSEKARG